MVSNEIKKQEMVKKWVNEWNSIPTDAVKIILDHEDVYSPINVPEDECMNMCGYPVAYSTMWTFDTSLDDDWALQHLEELYEIGVIVYESEHLGIVFGIDGTGYDFNKEHWVPMYDLRKLNWHI